MSRAMTPYSRRYVLVNDAAEKFNVGLDKCFYDHYIELEPYCHFEPNRCPVTSVWIMNLMSLQSFVDEKRVE